MSLTKSDYQFALGVQDACNLSGVVLSMVLTVGKIWDEAHKRGKGTDWVNKHPIVVAYVSKLASLCNLDDNVFVSEQFAACSEVVNGYREPGSEE